MTSLICGILKKNDTNEPIYKTETDLQTQRMNLWLPGGKGWVGASDRLEVWDGHVHTVVFKIDNQQGPTVKNQFEKENIKFVNSFTRILILKTKRSVTRTPRKTLFFFMVGTQTQNQFDSFYKIKHSFSCKPAIVFLGIYSKELKIYTHTKTCMWIFRAALFITAKMQRQPRCPSVSKFLVKILWHIQTMDIIQH